MAITISGDAATTRTNLGLGTAAVADKGDSDLLGQSGSAPIYGLRAWVNMRGGRSNSLGINASGNVSSVAEPSTGLYTISFATALPDANYAIAGVADHGQSTNAHYVQIGDVGSGDTYSTGAVQVGVLYSDAGITQTVDKVTVLVVG